MLHVADHDELLPETNECFVPCSADEVVPTALNASSLTQSPPTGGALRASKQNKVICVPLKMDLSLAWREQWLNLMFVSL